MRTTLPCLFGALGLFSLSACGDDAERESDSASATYGTSITGVTSVSTTITTSTSATSVTTQTSQSSDSSDTDGGSTSTTTTTTTGEPVGCSDDNECPPGQHCGPWSGECLCEGCCIFSEDCEGGQVCMNGMCQIGGDCGAQSFNFEPKPVNMMIVLDRSGSMDADVQNSPKSRWEVAKDAIFKVVDTYNDKIRFGLVTYSACEFLKECTAGKVVVPMGNLNADPIKNFLGPKGLEYLCNSGFPETSTGNTLQALVGYGALQDPQYTNAVMLVTDGNENSECQDNTNGALAAEALFKQPIPVRTFAVGMSDGIIGSLADIAAAGGTGMPYNATDPASLEMALGAIAGSVVSCDFVLDSPPDDPNMLYVFFNDDPAGIPMDPVNGWTFDPNTNTLSFHGAACEALKSGTVMDVDVVYGCDIPIPG